MFGFSNWLSDVPDSAQLGNIVILSENSLKALFPFFFNKRKSLKLENHVKTVQNFLIAGPELRFPQKLAGRCLEQRSAWFGWPCKGNEKAPIQQNSLA